MYNSSILRLGHVLLRNTLSKSLSTPFVKQTMTLDNNGDDDDDDDEDDYHDNDVYDDNDDDNDYDDNVL